jgi:hypothetical protein
MSQDNFADLLNNLAANFKKVLETPDVLQKLGIPDVVRVSPAAYAEMQAGGSRPEDLPWGLKIIPDPDLQGEKWELGPKPAASAASEPEAKGPAT